MKNNVDFTQGKIMPMLLSFMFPILGAHILQSLYGAVDLIVVGRFGTAADISAVSSGAQVMQCVANFVASLAMGATILIGQYFGLNKKENAGEIIGNAAWLFGFVGIALSAALFIFCGPILTILQIPAEAYEKGISYLQICGFGGIFVVLFNILGAIFRGMGDSKTPLLAVLIACIFNIAGDILLVGVFNMATAGAALATIISQFFSCIICLVVIYKRGLPFSFSRECFQRKKNVIFRIVKLGFPLAFQDILVNISFLVILAIVNSLGLIISAGVGVAEKVIAFIMLVSISFAQSISAFVSQNIGAGQDDRATQAMKKGMLSSLVMGIVIAVFVFLRGDLLVGIFTQEPDLISTGFEYLRAYAIDTILTCFLFCFHGYFNGCGLTTFTMVEGLIGAFLVRIPFSFYMSKQVPVSVFKIALATPCSTIIQITLCIIYYFYIHRNGNSVKKLV